MHLTFDALRLLDTIDRRGSFAAAAAELDKVPSALTYSVRKLEEDLDLLLFDRRGHRAKLTQAGAELLAEGRHLLRAAHELEQRVKRTATGCEADLRIVVDSIVPFERLLPLVADFDRLGYGTRLRFRCEVLSGVWEALLLGAADLAIGAPSREPETVRMSGAYRVKPLAKIDWVFAVAPNHPLAALPEPLTATVVQGHRAIAVGDTGRTLPLMTAGLLSGQHTLTVPNLQAKLAAQLAGLGCGYLPRSVAAPHFAAGRLVEKQTTETKPDAEFHLAWRADARGRSLQWFVDKLSEQTTRALLFGETAR